LKQPLSIQKGQYIAAEPLRIQVKPGWLSPPRYLPSLTDFAKFSLEVVLQNELNTAISVQVAGVAEGGLGFAGAIEVQDQVAIAAARIEAG
jgi:hypothetical protein